MKKTRDQQNGKGKGKGKGREKEQEATYMRCKGSKHLPRVQHL